jgi:hypothetical protein
LEQPEGERHNDPIVDPTADEATDNDPPATSQQSLHGVLLLRANLERES